MTAETLARASGRAANRIRFRFSFHLAMALIMAGVIVYGFSQTIDENLIHPLVPRPSLLYLHAAVFSAWLALYVGQTGLVASGNVRLHRRLGLAWIAVGTAVPLVGVPTAIVMTRFHIIHDQSDLPFLAIPLWDMVLFASLFLLAALQRHRPEFHRRLMFLATCSLMDAGFARFPLPDAWFHATWFYMAMDGLVLVAMARDLVIQRRVHVVFVVALPLMVVGQGLAWILWRHPPAAWISICRALVGAG